MSSVAQDVVSRLGQLALARADFEPVWRQVSDVAAPDGPDFQTYRGSGVLTRSVQHSLGMQPAYAARRSRKIFDSTAVWAVDRLGSGLEGLIMPQSETWHSLGPDDLLPGGETDEETEWFEAVRNYMFKVRYDAQSGWQTAIQACLRRLVQYGNSFMMVEEGFGRVPIRYRQIPLNECYIATDQWGNVDTFFRPYELTARQAVQKFGRSVSTQVQTDANDPLRKDKTHQFIHAITPRGDFGSLKDGVSNSQYASVHVEVDAQNIVRDSGFFEFPIIDFRWLPEGVYGEGPIMRVLADIQSMQLMSKNAMVASQQAIDPPLLIARKGIVNRPRSNAGATIVGGIDANGRKMIEPLITGQRPDFAQAVMAAKRADLKESLYINLFALMVENPRMSATEAMIRANEKGELLGPAGSRVQESLARLIEREAGILSRKGAFDEDSIFRVPESLQARSIGPKFTSPLDRLRRAKDAEAVIRSFEILQPLYAINPEALDNWDNDETVRGVNDVLGVPRRFMKRTEEVEAQRQSRAEQQAQQQAIEQANILAETAGKAAPALETLQGLGNIAA